MGSIKSTQKILGFLPAEALPGAVLVLCALAALLVVNSPLGPSYSAALATSVSVGPTGGGIEMSLGYWIKNALMAIFFFFVGLELKREILEGQLSNPKAVGLPILAAVGGMLMPAVIFLGVAGNAGYANGWAIPAATDIAFALGVLSLLGNRVSPALKAFLLAVAVIDDLGAIAIIAFFYSSDISGTHLFAAAVVSLVLFGMNRFKVRSIGLFMLVGSILWVYLHLSGISATISGVVVAACVPMIDRYGKSPLHQAEHDFRAWVLFGVMPVFAFANAGVSLSGVGVYISHPITVGSALGLAIGKPIGIAMMTVFGAWLLKSRPPGSVTQVIGVGCLAGIGFTMSLFVGALAFTQPELAAPVRLGVYAGSLVSALLGLAILAASLPKVSTAEELSGNDETKPFIGPEPGYEPQENAVSRSAHS